MSDWCADGDGVDRDGAFFYGVGDGYLRWCSVRQECCTVPLGMFSVFPVLFLLGGGVGWGIVVLSVLVLLVGGAGDGGFHASPVAVDVNVVRCWRLRSVLAVTDAAGVAFELPRSWSSSNCRRECGVHVDTYCGPVVTSFCVGVLCRWAVASVLCCTRCLCFLLCCSVGACLRWWLSLIIVHPEHHQIPLSLNLGSAGNP